MQRQVEELKRKSEQGSQQLQGEAQEIELEALLRSRFPGDLIEPVAKGEFGGDLLQRVIGPLNQPCGSKHASQLREQPLRLLLVGSFVPLYWYAGH